MAAPWATPHFRESITLSSPPPGKGTGCQLMLHSLLRAVQEEGSSRPPAKGSGEEALQCPALQSTSLTSPIELLSEETPWGMGSPKTHFSLPGKFMDFTISRPWIKTRNTPESRDLGHRTSPTLGYSIRLPLSCFPSNPTSQSCVHGLHVGQLQQKGWRTLPGTLAYSLEWKWPWLLCMVLDSVL